jgi:hypothetical protein
MKIEVKKATVILHRTTMDNVVIETDLPSPVAATVSDAPLALLFYATSGTGEAYVREHFGIEPEVVEDKDPESVF